MENKSAALMNDLVVEQARKALKGILGDASPKVVSAAQAALRRIDSGLE
jgi:vesicle coat complex subunit